VLFIGTKKQLGGMLTNFETIGKRVAKMQEYRRMRTSGEFDAMPKKEALLLSRELEKLERNLGGIAQMERLPDAVFILDTKKEHIGVTEANKLGIPIIAVVDTNCDPDIIQYVIPGNDDAIRSGSLMCRVIAEAVEEGRFIASRKGNGAAPAPQRTEDEEAEVAASQAEARRQALLAQQERDARVASGQGAPIPPPPVLPDAAPAAEPAAEAEPEVTAPEVEAPATEAPAPAAAAPAAAAPADDA
jgi:small subunit ribosomal protein S2